MRRNTGSWCSKWLGSATMGLLIPVPSPCRHTERKKIRRLDPLQYAAVITVSDALARSSLQFLDPCVTLRNRLMFLMFLQTNDVQLVTSLRLHVEVRADTVVLHHGAAVVDDTTFVRALVWRPDTGQTELVGDVAAGHFYNLKVENRVNFRSSTSLSDGFKSSM